MTIQARYVTERTKVQDVTVTYLEVVSDGTSGEGWIERIKLKGLRLSPHAESYLGSSLFVPTLGRRYKLAVIHGPNITCFRPSSDFNLIGDKGTACGLDPVSPEAILLIPFSFTPKEVNGDIGLTTLVGMSVRVVKGKKLQLLHFAGGCFGLSNVYPDTYWHHHLGMDLWNSSVDWGDFQKWKLTDGVGFVFQVPESGRGPSLRDQKLARERTNRFIPFSI